MRMKYFIRGPMLVLILSCCLRIGWSQDTTPSPATNSSSSSESSADSGSKFSFGAKALTNFSKFKNTDIGIGYGGGGFAQFKPSDALSFRAEVLYVNYAVGLDSYKTDFTSGSFSRIDYSNRNLRFNSLEIPVLVQYALPFMESLSPVVYAGGAYSYNFGVFEVTDKTYFSTGTSGEPQTHTFKNRYDNVSSRYKEYNVSVLGGIRVSFDPIFVELRYQQGIPNLNIFSSSSYSQLNNLKSTTLSVSVGMTIF